MVARRQKQGRITFFNRKLQKEPLFCRGVDKTFPILLINEVVLKEGVAVCSGLLAYSCMVHASQKKKHRNRVFFIFFKK